jgi:hypothetical protein
VKQGNSYKAPCITYLRLSQEIGFFIFSYSLVSNLTKYRPVLQESLSGITVFAHIPRGVNNGHTFPSPTWYNGQIDGQPLLENIIPGPAFKLLTIE